MDILTDLDKSLAAAERAAQDELAALRICEAAFVAALLLVVSLVWGWLA